MVLHYFQHLWNALVHGNEYTVSLFAPWNAIEHRQKLLKGLSAICHIGHRLVPPGDIWRTELCWSLQTALIVANMSVEIALP